MKKWSTREVAKLAGVSPATVSRVLNSHDSVAPDLAERVRAAIRTLEEGVPGARPMVARRVVVAFPRRIETYEPDPMGGVFYGQVLSGMHEVLREGGHDLSLLPYDPSDGAEAIVRSHQERFDGLILMGADSSEELAREAQRQGMPVIVVDKQVRGVDSVVSDNVGGAMEATAHVIEAGYRHLFYLCESFSDPSFLARRQGFEQAVAACGRTDLVVRYAELGRGWLDAPAVLAELSQEISLPVGLVAGNDMTALHMLALARAKGLSVPGQVGLAGFDDIALAARVDPALTTVRIDKMEMGRLAARRVLERMTMPDLLPITITMHVALVVRESTNIGGNRPQA